MTSLNHIFTNCAGVTNTRCGYCAVISFILLVCSHWPVVDSAPSNVTETTAVLADVHGNGSVPSVTTNTTSPVPNTGSSSGNYENKTDSNNSTYEVTSNTSPVPNTGSSSGNYENKTDSNNSTYKVTSNTTSPVPDSGSSSNTTIIVINFTVANSRTSVTTAPLDEDLIIVLSFGGFFILIMFIFIIVLCVRNACRPKYKRFPSTTPTANNIRLP